MIQFIRCSYLRNESSLLSAVTSTWTARLDSAAAVPYTAQGALKGIGSVTEEETAFNLYRFYETMSEGEIVVLNAQCHIDMGLEQAGEVERFRRNVNGWEDI